MGSEEHLLLSEELTLSLKRFEFVGYYYYFTLFLSFIYSLIHIQTNDTQFYSLLVHIAIILIYTTPISLILFMVELLFKTEDATN